VFIQKYCGNIPEELVNKVITPTARPVAKLVVS